MAIISIILPQQGEICEKEKKVKGPAPIGSYVISETFDGWFAFGLYDAKRKNLVNSTYSYNSIDAAKEAITSCRENGKIAETEDRSGLWIQEKYIPKFEICKYGEEYGFSLRVFNEDSLIHSRKFNKVAPCLALLEKVKFNIGATDIYMSVVKISDDAYKKWGYVEEEPVVEETVEEEPIIEDPVVEKVVEDEPVVEEPPRPKKCIVGVVWPESSNPDKIYRYQVTNGKVNVGDTVSAPTLDSYNQKEVIRKALVVSVEYYDEGENIYLPKKSIVSIENMSF